MFLGLKGGPLWSHLSAHAPRGDSLASAFRTRSETDRPTWALRAGRRLKVVCLGALLTIYIVYFLDIIPRSLESGVVVNPGSVATSNTTTKTEPWTVIGTDEEAVAEQRDVEKQAFIKGIKPCWTLPGKEG